MSQDDEFEFQGEATTNPEREQGAEGGQKREHAGDGMAVALETLCFLCFWNFEYAQRSRWHRTRIVYRHLMCRLG